MTKAELHQLIDELPDASVEGAAMFLRRIVRGPLDSGQAWFWTPEWQSGERAADAEIVDGSGLVFGGTDEFIAHLENVPRAELD